MLGLRTCSSSFLRFFCPSFFFFSSLSFRSARVAALSSSGDRPAPSAAKGPARNRPGRSWRIAHTQTKKPTAQPHGAATRITVLPLITPGWELVERRTHRLSVVPGISVQLKPWKWGRRLFCAGIWLNGKRE